MTKLQDATADSIDGGAGDDSVVAGSGNDTILGSDGNDTLNGSGGNDQIDGGNNDDSLIGGAGQDTVAGGAGLDTIIISAADLVTGESYDGGTESDTLRVDGGGAVSLAGITIANIENIALSSAAGTTLTVTSEAQATLVTSATASSSDKVIIQGFTPWSTLFSQLGTTFKGLFDAGVETVEWTEGGATNQATRDGGGKVTISATDTASQTWATSTFVFNAAGQKESFHVTFDDGHTATHTYTNGVLSQYQVLNLPDSANRMQTITDTYDSAGRMDVHEIVHYNGLTLRSYYDDAGARTSYDVNRVDVGGTNGWTVNDQSFTNSGQITSQHVVKTDGNIIDRSYTGGVITQEIITDGGAADAWTTITSTYAGGTLNSQAFLYDNGTALVQGTAGDNTLTGASGRNDTLMGRGGNDTFVFGTGFGNDWITDFNAGDKLNLTAFGITNLATLNASATVGAWGATDTVITIGANRLIVSGVTPSGLTDGSFVSA